MYNVYVYAHAGQLKSKKISYTLRKWSALCNRQSRADFPRKKEPLNFVQLHRSACHVYCYSVELSTIAFTTPVTICVLCICLQFFVQVSVIYLMIIQNYAYVRNCGTSNVQLSRIYLYKLPNKSVDSHLSSSCTCDTQYCTMWGSSKTALAVSLSTLYLTKYKSNVELAHTPCETHW